MSLKLRYKGPKIATLADAVVYTGMFLTGKVLEWFKLYLKDHYPYLDSSYFVVNLRIQRS